MTGDPGRPGAGRRTATGDPLPDAVSGRSVHAAHTRAYLLARGVPGVLTFLAIPAFTNLLPPAEYATYALVSAAVALANAVLYQWLRLAIVRCAPSTPDAVPAFVSTLATTWLAISLVAVTVTGVVVAAGPGVATVTALVVGCGTLVSQSLFDIVTEWSRARLRPWRYMVEQTSRSVVFVGLGVVLLLLGSGWAGPLIALIAGTLAVSAWSWRRYWPAMRPAIDRSSVRELAAFGLPVSITVGLSSAVFVTDRSLVNVLVGPGAAGAYSVAFDFTNQTIMVVMLAVSLSTLPLAVRAYTERRVLDARGTLQRNLSALLAIGAPAATGVAILSPGIVGSALGPGYDAAAPVMPIVALTAFLAGLKACHFDVSFQVRKRTAPQVVIVSVILVGNVLLNLLFIPRFGVVGAAWSSAAAFGAGLVLTAVWGSRCFPVPVSVRPCLQVLTATAAMAVALAALPAAPTLLLVCLHAVAGAAVYGAALVLVDYGDRRALLLRALRRAGGAGRTTRDDGPAVCMYSPFPTGGHPRYTAELLGALAVTPLLDGVRLTWMAGRGLESRYRDDVGPYATVPILPALPDRAAHRTTAGWIVHKLLHAVRRDLVFLHWLAGAPGVRIVHFQEVHSATTWITIRLVRLLGRSTIMTVHNVTPHTRRGGPTGAAVAALLRSAHRGADRLVVHSEGLREDLVETCGEPVRRRTVVVSHGVWRTACALPPRADELGRRLRSRTLLFLGAIRENKGLHLLLDAFAERLVPDCRLTIAGEPEDLDYVRDVVVPAVDRARAAGADITFRPGYVAESELSDLITSNSAVVLPYLPQFRAQSGVAYLALANGVPIISTRAGGLADLHEHYDCGIPIEAPSGAAVAAAVRAFLDAVEGEEFPRRFVEAITTLSRESSWDRSAELVATEYLWLVRAERP